MYGNTPHINAMPSATKTARLDARLAPETHDLIKRAAEATGQSVTSFVVSAASEAARKTIQDMDVIRLSLQDQKRFAQALIDPPEPSEALKRAFERRAKLPDDA